MLKLLRRHALRATLSNRHVATLDHGPIDRTVATVQIDRLQRSIVVCQPHGHARGDIPPPPRPQSPRALDGVFIFACVNWTRVQLDPLFCLGQSCPAWEPTYSLSQRPTSILTALPLRLATLIPKAWSKSPAARSAWDRTSTIRKKRRCIALPAATSGSTV